jgi:hypothetical protein
LSQGSATAHPLLNPLLLLAGLSVFFLAAFSAVKGLELYRRRRLIPGLLNEPVPLAEIKDNEELEKLSFLVDEIKNEKESLALQNQGLQVKVQELAGVLSNVKQTRDILEKSNLVLVKESAKLKSEKEDWLLKASEPLIAVKTAKAAVPTVAAKKKKAKAVAKTVQAKARRISKTKKGDRKPKRVSRKAK